MKKTYTIASSSIREYLWDVQKPLMIQYGTDESFRMMDPLDWYINTGRASCMFLHRLIEVTPSRISKILEKKGSHQEALDRIFRAIKFTPNN